MNRHSRARRNTIEHEEVMVVDLGVDRLGTRVLKVVFEGENRLVFIKLQRLLVDVGKAQRRLQSLGKGNLVLLDTNLPFSCVDDGITEAELIGRIVDLAQDTDSRLDKEFAWFCLVVIDGAETVARSEFFYRPGDRIVDQRIVVFEPNSKIGVAFVGEARNDARPIEARRAIVALLGIGQINNRLDRSVRKDSFGKIAVDKRGARGRRVFNNLGFCRWESDYGKEQGGQEQRLFVLQCNLRQQIFRGLPS